MERKLATIRRVADLQPIEGADMIEVASIDGWKVVCQKGLYKVGDLAIYLEIDSWVPNEVAPFLTKNAALPREYNGVKGERLRTVKLRGQISQGLLLPLNDPGIFAMLVAKQSDLLFELAVEGEDLTEALGIQKWEAPIPAQLQGMAKGTFPTHLVPKTDQERIQNCFRDVAARSDVYEITMKLDGSSMTLLRHEGVLRVASRNMELKISDENATNTFVALALKHGHDVLDGLAFQGEVMGPGIQGNREGLTQHEFFVFDIYEIGDEKGPGRYMGSGRRMELCKLLGMNHVPVLGTCQAAPTSVADALDLAEGPSLNHPIREGIVFKSMNDPSFSFKAISNKFLLKGGD